MTMLNDDSLKTCSKCGRRLSVDHDHKTGKIRGLLCGNCNLMIGYARENLDIMHKAALYIEKNLL